MGLCCWDRNPFVVTVQGITTLNLSTCEYGVRDALWLALQDVASILGYSRATCPRSSLFVFFLSTSALRYTGYSAGDIIGI